MISSPTPPPASARSEAGKLWHCGTLVYTKAGLFTLFSWMLWGDFCYTLMETIWANILPLVLKSEGAPNMVTALVVTTIPQTMNFVLNPIISTFSDRYRSKRGRRIPFLLYSAPFISLFLVLMGFSRQLGGLLHSWLDGVSPALTPGAVTVGLICVLVVCFRFFEIFVSTVFWYLFNDVVPANLIGRFLGLFRVIGGLAGAGFNFFLFQYAESHTSMIFLGGALLYGTGFLLLALNVKEGEYPPPDRMSEKKGFSLDVVKTYLKECLSHPIFRWIYAYSLLLGVAEAANIFLIFMAISIGLTIGEVGKVAAVVGVVGLTLSYPAGSLVDRIHPLRVKLAVQMGFCVLMLMKCVFLFHDFPREVAFWVYAGLAGIGLPLLAVNSAATLPMLMKIFPHERYGQFSAANAMCRALGQVVGGVAAGLLLDVLKRVFATSGDYYYRFVPAWSFIFMLLGMMACFQVFREWKKLGGDKNYRPPIEDKFADFHVTPILTTRR